MAGYLNEKYPSAKVQVIRNVNGRLDQVHWMVSYESLADMEELGKQLQEDAGYGELVAEAQGKGLFDGSTIVDNLYATVP